MSPRKNWIFDIPEPCHQSWDQMTPTMHGRHCAACNKVVVDFSCFSDAELYRYFDKNSQRVCGRFLVSQLNRPVTLPPQPPSRLFRLFVALGLTVVFTAGSNADLFAKQPFASNWAIGEATPLANDTVSIRGTVIDQHKEPLVNCSVVLMHGDSVVAGTITDFDGNYQIAHVAPGTYRLLFRYVGYENGSLDGVVVYEAADKPMIYNMVMTRSAHEANTSAVTRGGLVVIRREPETTRKESLEKKKHRKHK